MHPIDPVRLTADLVRCASVTPKDAGAMDVLYDLLHAEGFECAWADRGGIRNLFARWGSKGHDRSFGFNGHTDVVPVGVETDWTMPPFGAEVKNGLMYGRGTTDMKSGVAAFTAAAIDFVRETPPDGAVILAITGDEEGDAIDGTMALLDHMNNTNEVMSVCLVGEPTCPNSMGDVIKIGRRGSMTAWFTVIGKQGHSAYPHNAKNPLNPMMRLMDQLGSYELDKGTEHFDASTLAIVTVDVGNLANNVIPAQVCSTVNIRFNDSHTGESLTTCLVIKSVKEETGVIPRLSTSGGTSDARFVKNHCPVVEFGLLGQSMHQVDEHVAIEHIHKLKSIYGRILRDYFA